MFYEKRCLRNFAKFTEKHLYQSLYFNKVAGLRPVTLLKIETLAQVFSFEFCEISKKTFSYRTPSVAASGYDLHQPLYYSPVFFFTFVSGIIISFMTSGSSFFVLNAVYSILFKNLVP